MRRGKARVSPVLVIALTGLWLLLNGSASIGQTVLGAAVATGFAALGSRLRPLSARLRRPDTAILLLLVVSRDIVVSNLAVARIVLRSFARIPARSGWVHVPLALRDPHGIAALSAIVTATPGTVWAGLSESGDELTLHVLDLADEAALIRLIKERYERPLMSIFE